MSLKGVQIDGGYFLFFLWRFWGKEIVKELENVFYECCCDIFGVDLQLKCQFLQYIST